MQVTFENVVFVPGDLLCRKWHTAGRSGTAQNTSALFMPCSSSRCFQCIILRTLVATTCFYKLIPVRFEQPKETWNLNAVSFSKIIHLSHDYSNRVASKCDLNSAKILRNNSTLATCIFPENIGNTLSMASLELIFGKHASHLWRCFRGT